MRCEFEMADDDDHDLGARIAGSSRMVNAIPAVYAARPGLLSALDLPLVTGAGLVRPVGRAVTGQSPLLAAAETCPTGLGPVRAPVRPRGVGSMPCCSASKRRPGEQADGDADIGRCPSMNQDSTAATAGMMANSIATAAAPCTLMART